MALVTTMFGGRNCTGVLAPAYLSFFTASVSFIFFFVTVAGNSLICLLLYKDPKRQLRTPFNFLVLNLAVADLIIGLMLEPISVAIHLREGLTDGPLGKGIPTIHMSYFISCTASVLSLAALAVDRHIAVTSPHYYRANNSAKKALAASLVIWAISISLPFVYFKVGYISYAFVFANTAVIVTFITLIVSYASIFRKIRRQFEISAGLHAGLDEARARRKVQEDESRVTKAFMLVLLAFLLCYIPSCVMIYVMNFCSTCSCYSIHWLRDMQFLFVLLNSCLNPFLYAWRLPGFRKAFAALSHLPCWSDPANTVNLPVSMSRLTILSERTDENMEMGTGGTPVFAMRLPTLCERVVRIECSGRDRNPNVQGNNEETTNPDETGNPEEPRNFEETNGETTNPEKPRNPEETTEETTNSEERTNPEETTGKTTNPEEPRNPEETTSPKETPNPETPEDNEIWDSKL